MRPTAPQHALVAGMTEEVLEASGTRGARLAISSPSVAGRFLEIPPKARDLALHHLRMVLVLPLPARG